MKAISISTLTVLVTVTLIGSIAAAIIPLQHQASAIIINYKDFKKLSHEFERNVINAVGDPNISPGPRELLSAYVDDVNRIFLGGPDTILGLLEQYQQSVLAVFVSPPEPDKQQKHDQIKEFRELTHAFEKAVIGAVNPPEPE